MHTAHTDRETTPASALTPLDGQVREAKAVTHTSHPSQAPRFLQLTNAHAGHGTVYVQVEAIAYVIAAHNSHGEAGALVVLRGPIDSPHQGSFVVAESVDAIMRALGGAHTVESA